ncbi:MMPL family transporter [Dactylosporangium fulvum]|uniref:MMPL family transporter n=1 Tax=Dactylosporangium fulvum TaxID=53359 RepID=A0ABY5W278_9ACTN|nr:MMPL family transporter [Dactylosporangium fulvum]UWP84158.1 MMPL family transporter [Dactylosporangium fulvum]
MGKPVFAWWGNVVVRARWLVIAGGAALVLAGVLWGTGVFARMTSGGFDDPGSPSAAARARIEAEVGRQSVDVLALYSSPDRTVDDAGFRDAVGQVLSRLKGRSEVVKAFSFYDTQSPAFVSGDRRATYVAVQLTGQQDAELLHAIEPDLQATGLTTRIGGPTAIFADVSERVEQDIVRAETLSMPVLLILLLFVFRGVIAALLPLLVGVIAVLGAFVATRLLTYATDVSVFAINIITMIGLGMAIDYSLFVVSRFREELAAGRAVPEATRRTMTTAGRTVAVSGLTVALALASLLVFPQVFLRSMGFGGMAAVLVAMLAALTVLPALLAVLGHRVNAWRLPMPVTVRSRWGAIARAVMRRPVWVIAGTLVVLGVLASPFSRAQFGAADERVLPAGTESRVVNEVLAAEFPGGGTSSMQVLVSGGGQGAVADVAARIGQLPRVTGTEVAAAQGDSTLLTVTFTGNGSDEAARELARQLRELRQPGSELLVDGAAPGVADMLDSLADGLPRMALLAGLSTIVLLFLAFGSVLLPLKAVFMNLVSIGASFGAVVWVFQDGHLSGLLRFTSTGDLEASQLILMLAILFGLSTDYEVFLLSRVREEWDRTGDNTSAVVAGLERTGGIITSAALLLVIVVGGFATGGISFIKMLGVGMVVAILVDATIVRALLVPATMRLLGRANWWAPGPLARLYRRFGIKESDLTPDSPARITAGV